MIRALCTRSGALRSALLFGLLQGGCRFENYGLEYTRVELRAERADATPAARLPAPVCVTLPVLTGSVVEERLLIEDSLGVSLRATSEQVELRFFGAATRTEPRVVTLDELDDGYRSELEIESQGGTRVTVVLSSPCSADGNR